MHGVAYYINISLNTYEQIPQTEKCRLYIHFVVREDAQILYGFFNTAERELFRHLISVSGIGANTARLILSSLKTSEIHTAITGGNYSLLQKVKGVGAKTAQRLVVDLKDKLAKEGDVVEKLDLTHNNTKRRSVISINNFRIQ